MSDKKEESTLRCLAVLEPLKLHLQTLQPSGYEVFTTKIDEVRNEIQKAQPDSDFVKSNLESIIGFAHKVGAGAFGNLLAKMISGVAG